MLKKNLLKLSCLAIFISFLLYVGKWENDGNLIFNPKNSTLASYQYPPTMETLRKQAKGRIRKYIRREHGGARRNLTLLTDNELDRLVDRLETFPQRGYTYDFLAELSNVDKTIIHKIKRKKFRPSIKMATALNDTLDFLPLISCKEKRRLELIKIVTEALEGEIEKRHIVQKIIQKHPEMQDRYLILYNTIGQIADKGNDSPMYRSIIIEAIKSFTRNPLDDFFSKAA